MQGHIDNYINPHMLGRHGNSPYDSESENSEDDVHNSQQSWEALLF